MRLIKLNAIGSTNDYLRELSVKEQLENFTVVTAESQTEGRGQMGAQWKSHAGKNLTFSVLIKNPVAEIGRIYDLNAAVSVAVIKSLRPMELPDLSIKWPNDIMAGKKKIGGILIENSVKSATEILSVVGIGINVNQTDFADLPQASSLRRISGKESDKTKLLESILDHLQETVSRIPTQSQKIWENYLDSLFRKNIPMAFEGSNGEQFMGIITGVSPDGKLQVMLEDDTLAAFGLKEIKMLY